MNTHCKMQIVLMRRNSWHVKARKTMYTEAIKFSRRRQEMANLFCAELLNPREHILQIQNNPDFYIWFKNHAEKHYLNGVQRC